MSTLAISISKNRNGRARRPVPRHAKLAALAEDLVPAFHALRRARRSISLAEGETLTRLRTGRTFQDLGDVRFSDFVRERLLLHPRTARLHMTLHRMVREVPRFEGAFLSGGLDAGRILALKNVVTPGNSPYWIHLAAQLPLRELEKQVRRVRSETDPQEPESDRDGKGDRSQRNRR